MTTLAEFTIIKKLGDGAYSSVFKVKRQGDDDLYALKKVKMLNLSEKEKENALNEVRILASIEHPNVIGYKDAFIDEASSALCLIMELADNGDVFQKITNYQKRETYIKEKKIWYVFIQIVRGLKAFHQRRILHRDMKSANIFLFKDMQAKLGDLNVSKIVKKGLSYTQTGTPYYASPEVWRDMPYDSKSDIWSLGCILYEMCALVPPFRADDMAGLYKKVIKGKYPRIPVHFSQEMATVIKFMLQISPSYRPSCDQILALPIVESLSKKFFPDAQSVADIDQENQALLKTIRISRNLFSLTERLPKPKYRGRSNEVGDADSINNSVPTGQAGTFKLKNTSGAGSDGVDGPSPGKASQASRRGRSHEETPGGGSLPTLPGVSLDKNGDQQLQGSISKPRPHQNQSKRGSVPENNHRSPSYSKEKLRSIKGSDAKAGAHRRGSETYDEDTPAKHVDPMRVSGMGGGEFSELPQISQAHRKKDQSNPMNDPQKRRQSLGGDNDSIGHSNSNSNLHRAADLTGPSVRNNIRDPRGSAAPGRMIQKRVGDKVMQVYQQAPSSRQQMQMLYGGGNNTPSSGKLISGSVINGRRHKSLARGSVNPMDQQAQQMHGLQAQQLNRNGSRAQLQLPEINGVQPQMRQLPTRGNLQSRGQRLVSARSNVRATGPGHRSPLGVNGQGHGNNLSPQKIQNMLQGLERNQGKKNDNELSKIYMMQQKNGQEQHPVADNQGQHKSTPTNRGGQHGVGGGASSNLVGIMPASSSQGSMPGVASGAHAGHQGNPNGDQEINKIKLKIKQQQRRNSNGTNHQQQQQRDYTYADDEQSVESNSGNQQYK